MNSGDQNYREACCRYEKGDLDEAIHLFSKAIEYYSKSLESDKEAKAYYYRGCTYYRLGTQCERNQMFQDSEENFESALKDFDKASLNTKSNINEKSPEGTGGASQRNLPSQNCSECKKKEAELYYYNGCSCYKLGVLYRKKRMSSESKKKFNEALTPLKNALKGNSYKENCKLWFYIGTADYEVNSAQNKDLSEELKKAATHDYYDLETLKKLRPEAPQAKDTQEKKAKNILLLYYLKEYLEIKTKYSDDFSHINCLANLISDYGCEGAYYCALSHYELKEFRRSFEIFDKLTEITNDENCTKFCQISWYYKGLILRELKNACNIEEIIKLLLKRYTVSFEGDKNEFKQIIVDDSKISDYYRSHPKKRKKFINFISSEDMPEKLEYLGKCISVEATEDHVTENCASAWYFKAKIYKEQGEILEAKKAFQKVIDIESTRSFEESLKTYNDRTDYSQNSVLFYEKSLVLDELKRYNEAIKSLDESLKIKPRDAKAWLKKGTILSKIAVAEGKTAFEETKSENEKEKSPFEKEITGIEAAKSALEKSIEYYKILIDENPGNPDHWYNLGAAHSSFAEVLIKKRKYQDAIDEYEKAVRAFETATTLNPNFALAWNNKGNAYLKLQKYNKAIEAFEEALKINPNYYLALHNKGDALYSLGKYEEAIIIYDQVIYDKDRERQLDPNVYKSWNDKGLTQYRLENYKKSLEAFDKAIEINPTFADGWINKGVVFYKLEIFSEAKKAFEEALELEPGNSRASNNLGVVLARKGELDRAKKLFENTIQEDPDFILAHANLAELLLNSGGVKEASRKMGSISRDDKNPDPNMGYIHFLDGRIKVEDVESKEKKYSEAVESFEKAASFNVDNPIFLLWSVYAKYLSQKFETGRKTNSSEESKPVNENTQPETENTYSSELFHLIICDLEKVISFCKKPGVTRENLPENNLSEKINQDLVLRTILLTCTIAALIITLILGIKIFYPILKFLGILELVRAQFYTVSILLLLVILLITLYTKLKKLEAKELKIEDSTIKEDSKIKERASLYFIQLGIKLYHLESVSSRIRLALKSAANKEDSKSDNNHENINVLKNEKLKREVEREEQRFKLDKYKEIKVYTLYLLGYFYFKLQDYTTAKEKLQECISLRPDARTDKAARELLDNIWKHKIKPPFWTYWFSSPIKTWKRRVFGTLVVLGILLILFIHTENPQHVAWNGSTSNDPRNFIPGQINFYPYIISYYPANNTTSNPAGSESSNNNAISHILTPASMDIYLHYPANNTTSDITGFLSNYNNTNNENDSNNNTTLNILTPASVDIYPDVPDNYIDSILLWILIVLLISPSIRIKETVSVVLKKGSNLSLDLGPIVAPPEFNFELSPSLMQDVIKRLDENL